MRTPTALAHRIAALAAVLCLAALPAAAQLYSYHSAVYTEGNLFFYWPASNDGFAHAIAAGDFNGDGADDLATGIPGDDNVSGQYPDSGIVIVRYGIQGTGLKGGLANHVLSQFNGGSPDPPEIYDQFGWSLAAADFNGDGYDDLAVGALLDDSNRNGGGAVQIHYGSTAGLDLSGSQFFHQDSPGISGESESFDYFGYALAAGNFDGNGYADLAIGVPGESSDFDISHGRVVTLYGTAAGLSASQSQAFHQDLPGMDGSNENDDNFGRSLAAGDFNGDGRDDLAVGVTGENDGGGLHVILGSASGLTVTDNNLWTQDDPGVQEEDEDGDGLGWALAVADYDGDGYDDIAVGAPGESVDLGGGATATEAGAVHVFFGSPGGISGNNSWIWTSSSTNPGSSENSDFWGWSLAAGDFDADGYADLAVGAPGETISFDAVGEVTILRGHPDGLTFWEQVWNQDSLGVPDANEDGDQFGRTLAVGNFDGNGHSDLLIGTTRESTAASADGAEWVLYGYIFADGLETGNTSRWQATQSSTVRNTNQVVAATDAKLGTAASQYGLRVSLHDGASNSVYVMAGPARGFANETTLEGSFFIDPQGLTMSTTAGLNSFQMLAFNDGVGAGSLTRLIFSLNRSAGGWFINVSHWNENTASLQFAGGGIFALANDPNWRNNRIDFAWTRGNPGHLTMWRTRYMSGVPDASGRIEMFSINLPGMQNAAINYVFAGMFAGQDPGTFGTLYLDEFSFSR
jgi:hypothetical protein